MYPQSKNAESLLMAHVNIFQTNDRKICDDSPKFVDISSVLARRCLLLRYKHKLALGNQQRSGWTYFTLKSAETRRPLYGGQQPLILWPVTLRLGAKSYRPRRE